MEDSSIFEALQRAGVESVACDYNDARLDGWRTIDDLAVLADCSRSTMIRVMSSAVSDGKWETIKVKVAGGWKAAAYREILTGDRLNSCENDQDREPTE